MSVNLLSVAAVTTVISLIFTILVQYFPVINVKWGGLPKETKKYVVLGGYIVVGAVVAWGGCLDLLVKFIPQLLCVEPAAFLDYLGGVVIAVGLGQGVFGLAPEAEAVKFAKSLR
ncbi:MAG: hypothetical protein WC935_00165 [Thermoleophilia bacterium]